MAIMETCCDISFTACVDLLAMPRNGIIKPNEMGTSPVFSVEMPILSMPEANNKPPQMARNTYVKLPILPRIGPNTLP